MYHCSARNMTIGQVSSRKGAEAQRTTVLCASAPLRELIALSTSHFSAIFSLPFFHSRTEAAGPFSNGDFPCDRKHRIVSSARLRSLLRSACPYILRTRRRLLTSTNFSPGVPSAQRTWGAEIGRAH